MNQSLRPRLLTGLVLLGVLLVVFVPSVAAVQRTEGFEDITPGISPETNELYTYTSANADSRSSSAQAHTGNHSLRYQASATGNHASFGITEQCGLSNELEFTFWTQISALPASGDTIKYHIAGAPGTGDPANRIGIQIDSLGDITVRAENSASVVSSSATFETPMPVGSWVDFHFDSDCTEASGGVFSATFDEGVAVDVASGSIAELDTFAIQEGTTTGGGAFFYVDDFAWEFTQQTGDRFCANPVEANFGYDYLEGVEFNEDIFTAGISLEDAFVFEGDSGNSEYLAKGYNPGTEAFMVRARLEASGEGGSSKFRIAFTTGATVLAAGSAQDSSPSGTDFLASSDGEDGGNFDDHVQIILAESGDHWTISAWYNVGGAGLTQIPGAINYGANPNSPTTFQIVVNSGTNPIPATIENHTLADIGDNAISVQDHEGNIIFNWQLPAGLFNAEWKDQWFIGKGVTAFNAFTYLDDTEQLQDDDSTCLWDLLGTGTRTGSAGLAPGSTVIDPIEDGGDGSNLFLNFIERGFMAFLLIFGVVWMGIARGVMGAGLTALFLIGVGLAYNVGWLDLWWVLILFVVTLAAVWFLPKPTGDGV